MNLNMRKTEYMCVNEREVIDTAKMQGEEVAKKDQVYGCGERGHG